MTNAYQLFVLSPRYATLLGSWTFPGCDYYFIVDAMRHPGMALGTYGLLAAGLVVGTIMLIRNIRRLTRMTAA